ncbi:MAG TPA: ribosome maturation factor RimM [Pseudothermotoga sp.]|nr:ribosome maturation factor RimM [Pseudothermotoga sp.]HOK84475.1 ribosome maturation factor RimM [Pseudothermotoga sp.]HPP70923.1 ribosome maturation factor RimM [Pseudothermotoga sp.]
MKGYVTIGRIARTHGLSGNVKVQPMTNVLQVFDKIREALIYDEVRDEIYTLQVQEIKRTDRSILAKFYGIDSEKDAAKIVGLQIVMKVEDLPQLNSKDEYYYYEILDVDVFDENGNFLGKVCDIIWTGSNEVLVVKDKDKEILLPMIHDYVLEFHRQKQLIVKVPEWI